jgi:hypothetical protein
MEPRQRTENQQVAITAQAPVPFAPLPVDLAACLSAMAAGRRPSALYKSLATHTASSVKASDRQSRLLVLELLMWGWMGPAYSPHVCAQPVAHHSKAWWLG